MSTWPTAAVDTTNCDQPTDSPASFRTNILDAIQKLNSIIGIPPVPSFPSGTSMPFCQAAAPTGWTQDTTDASDNRMLRVVKSSGAGVGGSHSPILMNVVPSHTHGFTTGLASADHSHGIGDPGHSHILDIRGGTQAGGFQWPAQSNYIVDQSQSTRTAYTGIWTGGMSAQHTHSGSTDNGSSSTNWQPRYIDMIVCIKN